MSFIDEEDRLRRGFTSLYRLSDSKLALTPLRLHSPSPGCAMNILSARARRPGNAKGNPSTTAVLHTPAFNGKDGLFWVTRGCR